MSYQAKTHVTWSQQDHSLRVRLWEWMEDHLGPHGAQWSANAPNLRSPFITITTLDPAHHALVMLTWG